MRVHVALCSLVVATAAGAQPRIGLDVGAAVPPGNLGRHRSAGVAATLSASGRGAGLSPRLDVSWARLFDDGSSERVSSDRGDYTSAGLRLSVMYRSRGRGVAPYGLVGGGLYTLDIEDQRSPYGDLFVGLHAAAGVEVPVRSVALAAEVGAVAMATDYGAYAWDSPTVWVPVTVGVRF